MSFKLKIAVLFIALSLIPIGIVSTVFFGKGKAVIEQKTIDHLITTNESKKVKLETWIRNNFEMLTSISKLPVFQMDLVTIIQSHDENDSAHATLHQRIRDYLSPFTTANRFLELFITDLADGRVAFSSDPLQEGKYKDDRPFFKQGKNAPFFQDIGFDVAANEPTMILSVPLLDSHQEPVAILGGKVNLKVISDIFERRNLLSPTEDSYLVNQFNYFITEPRFGHDYALKKTVHTKGIETAREKGRFIGRHIDYRQTPVLGEIRWLPEWKLLLVTEVDLTEAQMPVNELKQTVLLMALLLSTAAAVIGWFLSSLITRPIDALKQITRRIGRGDFNVTTDLPEKGEFYDLAKAFSNMARSLQATMVSKEKLEQEITERIESEKKIAQYTEKLKQSNEDLQQFAYVASHDLQEPLRMVSSFTQLLADRYGDQLDEKAHKWIDFAVDGANRMQKLIQDLLEFSRVTTHGKRFTEMDMNQAVRSAMDNLNLLIKESGASIECRDLPRINADESQMAMLFQNLINNAIKFCKNRPPEIDISAKKRDDQWVFCVQDNGIGIESEFIDKIFIIFQRLHNREEFPGTGLGLAVCKRIVQRHQGNIWVESEYGKGSVFYFSLPAD